MKNFKKHEKLNRDEKRRLLFNNKYVTSENNEQISLTAETAPANAGAAEGVMSWTKAHMRALIAILVAVAVVLPGLLVFSLHGRAAINYNENPRYEDQKGTNISELETSKTVIPNDDGTWTVHLEAYQSAQMLTQPNLDIMLVLDVATRMNDIMYTRDYVNLNNTSKFTEVEFSPTGLFSDKVNHSDMYDNNNAYFERDSNWNEKEYSGNKYVKDPNDRDSYVYLSQSFNKYRVSEERKDGLGIKHTYYKYIYEMQYFFTDSHGNDYQTEVITVEGDWNTVDALAYTSGALAVRNKNVDSLTFILQPKSDTDYSSIIYTENDPYTITSFYTRDDNTSKNDVLYALQEEGRQLYIRDNNGVIRPLTITTETSTYPADALPNYAGSEYITDYIYTCEFDEDGDGTIDHRYVAHQGNNYYGADRGVFQGFKAYTYDSYNDQWVLDFDNTLVSKKLYYSLTEEEIANGAGNVSRLQSMKESVEQYLLMAYMSAYEHQGGAEVHVGVVTYGNEAKLNTNMDTYKMSVESDVNTYIDKIYSITAESNDKRSRIDKAMIKTRQEFLDHIDRSNCEDDQDPKRVTVVFSAGVPSKTGRGGYYGDGIFIDDRDENAYWARRGGAYTRQRYWDYSYSVNQFNVPVADVALQYGDMIKNDLGSQIYTIGMFGYANKDQLYGDKYYYLSGDNDQSWWKDYTNKTGNVGTYWGYTAAAKIQMMTNYWNNRKDTNIDPIEAAASNRFLNYLSSNYTDAQLIGLRRRTDFNPNNYLLATSGDGFKIIKNYNRASDDYYTSVDTEGNTEDLTQDLVNAFHNIGEKTQIADTELHTTATFTDVISDYFQMVPNTLSVTETHIDNTAISGAAQTLTWTLDGDVNKTSGKEIVVNGFDYSYYNSTGQYTDYQGKYGNNIGWTYTTDPRKLVVEFQIERVDDFIGGNNVPTNLGSSGVTDSEERMEELFQVPRVDVILDSNALVQDTSIYTGNNIDLEDLLNQKKLDGFNNEFVDITYTVTSSGGDTNTYTVPASQSEGTWSRADTSTTNAALNHPTLYSTETYTITYNVTVDESKGTLRNSIDANSESATAHAYVFQPSFTEKDGQVEPNTNVDLSVKQTLDDGYEMLDWICPGYSDVALPKGDPTVLTLTISDLTNNETFTLTTKETEKLRNIADTTDFQITKVTTPAMEYQYADMSENDTENELDPLTVTVAAKDLTKGSEVFFMNALNVKKDGTQTVNDTDGNFTIHTSLPFDLYISKVFSGAYAVPEDLTITITGSDGSTQTITFDDETDFTGLTSDSKKASVQLKTGVTYTVVETYTNGTDRIYITTATEQLDSNAPISLSNVAEDGDDASFQFKVDNDSAPNEVRLILTNEDTTDFPVTGISEDAHSSTVLLIALAATATVSAGGYGLYRVYKPRKED